MSVRDVSFPIQAPDLKDSLPARAIAERQAAWKAEMPKDEDALWDWISGLERREPHGAPRPLRLSRRQRALREGRPLRRRCLGERRQRRIAQADRLARAVSLDVVEAGWRPTVENYLGRVPKVRILEAVREARGEQSAQLIDHLKKADMAKEAERLLEGTGWLPEPLRTMSAGHDVPQLQSDDSEALPDFLTGDGDELVADGEGANPTRDRRRVTRGRRAASAALFTVHILRLPSTLLPRWRRLKEIEPTSAQTLPHGLAPAGPFLLIAWRGRGWPRRVETVGLRERAWPASPIPALLDIRP